MFRIPLRYLRTVFKGRTSEWAQKDMKQVQSIHNQSQQSKRYQKKLYQWQHPLQLKRQYRARRQQREKKITPAVSEPVKFVLHSFTPQTSIFYPRDDQIFAVLLIGGRQYKVTQDDQVMCDKLPYDIGTKVEFDSVLLVGTPSYSLIGRPVVETARVVAVVEEQTQTQKVLIFKMRRRKGYKRFKGHRQEITVIRIEKITHEPEGPATLFLPIS